MTDKDKMLAVGMNPAFIYTAKGEKLDYIKTLDKDIGRAFVKYFEESNRLADRLMGIYYELQEKGRGHVYAFSLFIRDKGIYKYENSFYNAITASRAFYDDRTMSFKKFKKNKQIIEAYEEFIREGKI
jgi:hypothetical protein